MQDHINSGEARERVLDAAERLFAQRGYTAVTLRDIAAEVGIRHTSLYHHVPGGKEDLFVEVTERYLKRHHAGLLHVIAQADTNVRSQLRAIASWLLSETPVDMVRMNYSDIPAISAKHAQRISLMTLEAMIEPIAEVLKEAQRRGEIQHTNLGLVAGGLFGMIESLHAVPEYALELSRQDMAYELIDVMLNGLKSRTE